jgi:hypothetical protein
MLARTIALFWAARRLEKSSKDIAKENSRRAGPERMAGTGRPRRAACARTEILLSMAWLWP